MILNSHSEFCLPRITRICTNNTVPFVQIRVIRGEKNYNVVYIIDTVFRQLLSESRFDLWGRIPDFTPMDTGQAGWATDGTPE